MTEWVIVACIDGEAQPEVRFWSHETLHRKFGKWKY
jgi:hypothetical protein